MAEFKKKSKQCPRLRENARMVVVIRKVLRVNSYVVSPEGERSPALGRAHGFLPVPFECDNAQWNPSTQPRRAFHKGSVSEVGGRHYVKSRVYPFFGGTTSSMPDGACS
jgi:hypothetical protein